MNKYELGVIIRADLDDEAYKGEIDRVKGLVERFGGAIEKIDDWGRRKLAYPIQKLPEGMYTFITYSSESKAPNEIEGRLRLMETVLRFLTVCKDDIQEPDEPAAAEEGEAAAQLEAGGDPEKPGEPVSAESSDSGGSEGS